MGWYPGTSHVIQEVVMPSSDEDFQVLVSSLCTGSSPDSGNRRPSTHGDVHAVRPGQCSSRRPGQCSSRRSGRPRLGCTTYLERGPPAGTTRSQQLIAACPVHLWRFAGRGTLHGHLGGRERGSKALERVAHSNTRSRYFHFLPFWHNNFLEKIPVAFLFSRKFL